MLEEIKRVYESDPELRAMKRGHVFLCCPKCRQYSEFFPVVIEYGFDPLTKKPLKVRFYVCLLCGDFITTYDDEKRRLVERLRRLGMPQQAEERLGETL